MRKKQIRYTQNSIMESRIVTDIINMESFSDRLFTLLSKNGITQTELCRKTGLSPTTISSWKSRGSIPRADDALLMADMLGVPIEYLVYGSAKRQPTISDRIYKLEKKQLEIVDAVVTAFEIQNRESTPES